MNNFYMVYVENQGTPTYRHGTYESAKQEAERLAQLPGCKGKKVYIFVAIDYCVCPPAIQWEHLSDIPF